MELSRYLPNIRSKMFEWAKMECLEHKGYATKSRVICLDCGLKFSPELVNRKRATCPHCGAKLRVEQSKCRTDKQHQYIAIADTYGEFQVIRNFEIWAYYKAGESPRYFIHEILQHWIILNGKSTVVALNHTINWYCDSWNGDMEIRNEYRRHYYSNNVRYDVYPFKLHPDSEFLSELKRYGIDYKLQGITPLEAIKEIPDNPKMETLLKAKQYDLLGYALTGASHKICIHWDSIKICMRNRYTVKDASIWFDYLELLQRYGKDLHNAHYVCPKNLKTAHDLYMEKKRKDDVKEEKERDMEKLLKQKKNEEEFIKLKSKFFDLILSDGKIVIVVLKSLEDFKQEGEVMHHCVFTNEYIKKKDSLILSARIGEKRLETIEISLKTLAVIQSRGACNSNTEYHDRIIGLVKKNIGLIRQKLAS